jgi:hypothetical protein
VLPLNRLPLGRDPSLYGGMLSHLDGCSFGFFVFSGKFFSCYAYV